MPVDPAGQDLKRYLKEDPGGPVAMLNLLKYRPDGERSYHSYSAALEEYLPSIGAEVLYVGAVLACVRDALHADRVDR